MDITKAQIIATELMAKHLSSKWKLCWNEKIRIAGTCYKTKKLITLSKIYFFSNTESECIDTILHEIAHALCRKRGHNKYWRAWCVKIGARPQRCYPNDCRVNKEKLIEYKLYQKTQKSQIKI